MKKKASSPQKSSDQVETAKINMISGIIIAIITLIGTVAGIYYTAKPKQPQVPDKIIFVGHVIDAGSRMPVVGARVTLSVTGILKSDTTDSDGNYEFEIPVKTNTAAKITVDAAGYQPFTRNLTITPSSPSADEIQLKPYPSTFTPQPPPTATYTPVPTHTFTPPPSPTSTLEVKNLGQGCIFSETWAVGSTNTTIQESVSVKPDGCYSMGQTGLSADNNGILNIYLRENKSQTALASGIYTFVQDTTVIEFKVAVEEMYLVYNWSPTYITVAIAPESSPMDARKTARFKLQVNKNAEDPFVYAVVAEAGQPNGRTVKKGFDAHYKTTAIKLELNGTVMDVYMDGRNVSGHLTLPPGSKVLYVGYELPTGAHIDANISELKIDGLPK